jgi:hypothetical protein
MKNQIKVYVSHSIRGKKGKDATREDMQHNNRLAIIFGQALRRKFPGIDFYVPGDHDEFVLIAYKKGYLSEDQILDVDCEIVRGCHFVLAYSPDGYLSGGMKVEIEYAGDHGIPVTVISKLDNAGQNLINQQIQLFMR